MNTIRLRLLKLSGVEKISVRRLRVALSSAFPLQAVFTRALRNVQAYPTAPG